MYVCPIDIHADMWIQSALNVIVIPWENCPCPTIHSKPTQSIGRTWLYCFKGIYCIRCCHLTQAHCLSLEAHQNLRENGTFVTKRLQTNYIIHLNYKHFGDYLSLSYQIHFKNISCQLYFWQGLIIINFILSHRAVPGSITFRNILRYYSEGQSPPTPSIYTYRKLTLFCIITLIIALLLLMIHHIVIIFFLIFCTIRL